MLNTNRSLKQKLMRSLALTACTALATLSFNDTHADPNPEATPQIPQATEPEWIETLLLIRVDPSVYPTDPKAFQFLILSPGILEWATNKTLGGTMDGVVIHPVSAGEKGLVVFKLNVHIKGDDNFESRTSAEANAFIQAYIDKIEETLQGLTKARAKQLNRRYTEALIAFRETSHNATFIENELASLRSQASLETLLKLRQAAQEALIQQTASEAQQNALLEKLSEAFAKREPDQVHSELFNLITQFETKINEAKNTLGAQHPTVRALETQLQQAQAQMTEALEPQEEDWFSLTNIGPFREFRDQLVEYNLTQVRLATLTKEYTKQAAIAEEESLRNREEMTGLHKELQKLRVQLEIQTAQRTEALRQQHGIIQPEVRVIR